MALITVKDLLQSVELDRSAMLSPPPRNTCERIGMNGKVALTTMRLPRFALPSGHVDATVRLLGTPAE